MKALTITYYVNKDLNEIKPYVHPITKDKNGYNAFAQLVTKVEDSNLSQTKKEQLIDSIYSAHYIMLMNNGYSYEEIYALLEENREKSEETARRNKEIGLIKQIKYLTLAENEIAKLNSFKQKNRTK